MPIPYSEIGSTGKIQVAYDDQPKVYSQMFDELDEAIALLDENIDRSITSTTDQVFDGTAVKWCRFANSMKLRLAMRVVYTDFVSSKGLSPQQLGEQAVAHSVGVMQSNADNAQLSSLPRQGRQSALYGMHVQLPSWVGDGRRFACCS